MATGVGPIPAIAVNNASFLMNAQCAGGGVTEFNVMSMYCYDGLSKDELVENFAVTDVSHWSE
jgi:hypothetical protein